MERLGRGFPIFLHGLRLCDQKGCGSKRWWARIGIVPDGGPECAVGPSPLSFLFVGPRDDFVVLAAEVDVGTLLALADQGIGHAIAPAVSPPRSEGANRPSPRPDC